MSEGCTRPCTSGQRWRLRRLERSRSRVAGEVSAAKKRVEREMMAKGVRMEWGRVPIWRIILGLGWLVGFVSRLLRRRRRRRKDREANV